MVAQGPGEEGHGEPLQPGLSPTKDPASEKRPCEDTWEWRVLMTSTWSLRSCSNHLAVSEHAQSAGLGLPGDLGSGEAGGIE